VENQSLRAFLHKYTKETIPSESTLRKNYVDVCYNSTVDRIRAELIGKKIWISIDESTDATGRHIANVIVGPLELDQPPKLFLLTSENMERVNSTTIVQIFANALYFLWPDGITHNNVILLI